MNAVARFESQAQRLARTEQMRLAHHVGHDCGAWPRPGRCRFRSAEQVSHGSRVPAAPVRGVAARVVFGAPPALPWRIDAHRRDAPISASSRSRRALGGTNLNSAVSSLVAAQGGGTSTPWSGEAVGQFISQARNTEAHADGFEIRFCLARLGLYPFQPSSSLVAELERALDSLLPASSAAGVEPSARSGAVTVTWFRYSS